MRKESARRIENDIVSADDCRPCRASTTHAFAFALAGEQLLGSLVEGLVLLVLVEHLLDLLDVLLIQLLVIGLPLESGAAILVTQIEFAIVG